VRDGWTKLGEQVGRHRIEQFVGAHD
jgi:hypothetical protein